MGVVDGLPPTLDLDLYAGDDYTIPLTVTRGGAAVDLTGVHLVQMRPDATSDLVLMTMTVQVTNAAQGKANLLVDGALTQALVEAGAGVVITTRREGAIQFRVATLMGEWDWQNTAGAADTTYCRGTLTLTADVSRPT